ncbi:MAG TPA: hypothetical protein VKW77_06175, partial [Acidimicrobiales bacterium]|nr:hypothetical protein [Acidimicrobiales bacterium]
VLPTVFAILQGTASRESASLDPFDPASPHFHPEGAGEFTDGEGASKPSGANGSASVAAGPLPLHEGGGRHESP